MTTPPADSAALSRRERLHAATLNEILDLARRQMRAHGAGSLSLRGIAREMGMSAPGLYRYFASRDELITALIVEAYLALGAALEAAAHHAGPLAERARSLALAFRGWALANPAEYVLILGTPLPGYHAPFAVTQPVARQAFAPFIRLLAEAAEAGLLAFPADSPGLPAPLERVAISVWARLHGLITLELFGHLAPMVDDVTVLYEAEVQAVIVEMFRG